MKDEIILFKPFPRIDFSRKGIVCYTFEVEPTEKNPDGKVANVMNLKWFDEGAEEVLFLGEDGTLQRKEEKPYHYVPFTRIQRRENV